MHFHEKVSGSRDVAWQFVGYFPNCVNFYVIPSTTHIQINNKRIESSV